jgi:hypothetical protein
MNFNLIVYFNRNNVPFLRGFPVERLNEIPNAIQHCNFGYIYIFIISFSKCYFF